MSDILDKFTKLKTYSQSLGHQIRLFYVFDDYLGKNCSYMTNDDQCYAFGANLVGCLGFGHNEYVDEPRVVPELSGLGLNDLYRGNNFMIGLTEDKSVYCWGHNDCGQLGLGFVNMDNEILKPTLNKYLGDENIASISCGYKHVIAITSKGNVFGWGDNRNGQVGCGTDRNVIDVPINLSSISSELIIKSIACGDYHSLALTADNFVFGWGSNEHGQLATGDFLSTTLPKLVSKLKLNILKIICSKNTTYLLTKQGRVFFCGENYSPNKAPKTAKLVEIQCDTPLVDIMSCWPTCMARTDGCVYELMKNELSFFETNYKNFDQYFIQKFHLTHHTMSLSRVLDCTDIEGCLIDHLNLFPEHLKTVIEYCYVFDDIDGKNCIYVTKDDNVFGFGSNYCGILGIGDIGSVEEPMAIRELCSKGVTTFFSGNGFVWAKNSFNEIFCWGNNKFGQLGLGYECSYMRPIKHDKLSMINVEDMACGQRHVLALTRSGEVYGWGGNEFGQVGAKSKARIISVATKIDIFLKIKAISVGDHHSMVLTNGKSVFSWGKNQFGQLAKFGYDKCIGPTIIVANDIIGIVCNQDNSYLLAKEGTVTAHGQVVCAFNSRANKVMVRLTDHTDQDTRLHVGNDGSLVATCKDSIYELRRHATQLTKLDHFRFDYSLASTNNVTKEPVRITQFDRIRCLGSGSFGTVYLCRDRCCHQSREPFTVKVLNNQDLDYQQCGNILSELERFGKIKSDNLAPIREIWVEKSKIIHMKMDFFECNLIGLTLEKYRAFERPASKQMSLVELAVTMEIYRQIVCGVKYLHDLSPPISHRNLKPTNILISNTSDVKSCVKISDFCFTRFSQFGLKARYEKDMDIEYSSAKVLYGNEYGLKSDIYSLAVIGEQLFEIDRFGNPDRRTTKSIVQSSLESITRLFVSMQLIPKWWLRPDADDVLTQLEDQYPSSSQLTSSTDFNNIFDSLKCYKMILFYEIVKSLI